MMRSKGKPDSGKAPNATSLMMMLIALGSNISGAAGAPQAVLAEALATMEDRGLRVARQSGWWRTPAHPPGSGPDFINAAAAVETALAPDSVLATLHEVEASLGRLRSRRWEPRVCDLDLLGAGALVLPDRATVRAWMAVPPEVQVEQAPDRLILPHPRLHERGFVLAPLAEVAPDWVHPVLGLAVLELLERLPGPALAGVERL